MSHNRFKVNTTIKDLALALELAPSTISKSLNDSSEISYKTKLRVKEMAREYGYIPNNAARSLKMKQTKSIGVILPNVTDDFFAKILQGIEQEACRKNYKLIVVFSDDLLTKETYCLDALIGWNVDGVLISLAQETQKEDNYSHFKKLYKYALPIVLFDRTSDEIQCDQVTIDDFDGAYRATKYLLDTGCNKIAFLSTIPHTNVGELRKEGYVQAIRLEGCTNSQPILIKIEHYCQFKAILFQAISSFEIDGIICTDERAANVTMNILQHEGIRVPEDISIIGFTDETIGEFSNPPLTTIAQHTELIGTTAFRVLLNRIDQPLNQNNIKTVVKSKLMIRESTMPVSINQKVI